MSYKRKTCDEYQIHVDYGQGFEHEHTEQTRKGAKESLRDYRTNAPQFPAKIVKKRVPIDGDE